MRRIKRDGDFILIIEPKSITRYAILELLSPNREHSEKIWKDITNYHQLNFAEINTIYYLLTTELYLEEYESELNQRLYQQV